MISDFTAIKEDADLPFKVSKAMCQASTTAPREVMSNIEQLIEMGIYVPGQFLTAAVRFAFTDHIKFSKFEEVVAMINDSELTNNMEHGGMSPERIESFSLARPLAWPRRS